MCSSEWWTIELPNQVAHFSVTMVPFIAHHSQTIAQCFCRAPKIRRFGFGRCKRGPVSLCTGAICIPFGTYVFHRMVITLRHVRTIKRHVYGQPIRISHFEYSSAIYRMWIVCSSIRIQTMLRPVPAIAPFVCGTACQGILCVWWLDTRHQFTRWHLAHADGSWLPVRPIVAAWFGIWLMAIWLPHSLVTQEPFIRCASVETELYWQQAHWIARYAYGISRDCAKTSPAKM